MTRLTMRDVRSAMPNFANYRDVRRDGAVTGIAIHHSATANVLTGVSMETAASVFSYHVDVRRWSHGGYHYVIQPTGLIEYALDEQIPGFHAGFVDDNDECGLECGQYWNNHLLAICLLGWFDQRRVGAAGPIPDQFTAPSPRQWRALIALLQQLLDRYGLRSADIKGHRELTGCSTQCPGHNVDLDGLRRAVDDAQAADQR